MYLNGCITNPRTREKERGVRKIDRICQNKQIESTKEG